MTKRKRIWFWVLSFIVGTLACVFRGLQIREHHLRNPWDVEWYGFVPTSPEAELFLQVNIVYIPLFFGLIHVALHGFLIATCFWEPPVRPSWRQFFPRRKQAGANVVRVIGYLTALAIAGWYLWWNHYLYGDIYWFFVAALVFIEWAVVLYTIWFASLAARKKGETA